MAGRPRCACCKRAFTPNFRNRTKTGDHRQRVCAREECRIEGHRLAQERYRESPAEPHPSRWEAGKRSQQDNARSQRRPLTDELASLIRRNSPKIAALLANPVDGDSCEASGPLPVGNGA